MSPRQILRQPWAALLVGVVLTWGAGCATSGPGVRLDDGGGFGIWEKGDEFQLLQQAAGLEERSWHEAGEELETDDARALWKELERTRTTLQNFGPRRSLFFLLGQVLSRGEDVPYAEMLERLRPFGFLVVMRPDGYLANAFTGKPLQRMGWVELRDGRLMAGAFEIGAFYRDKGGVFFAVDGSLRQTGPVVGELGLERDWVNAALDGTEDALAETARALGHFVTSPVRSLQGLQQLPSAVAALIASSPDYFSRYSALPLQEQIREAARLSTHLLLLYGGSAGIATRIGTVGAQLPVLSLTAEGALAMKQVAVPVGATAAALGTGAGAIYVLMESGDPLDKGGSAQPSGTAGEASRGFKSFTEGNFRENLTRLTGKMPEGAHAHHVFPQKLAKDFQKVGINVHDPRFVHGGSGPVTSRTQSNTSGSGRSSSGPAAHMRRFSSLAESWEASMGSKSTSSEFPGFNKIFYLGGTGSRKAFRGDLGVETIKEVFALTRAEMQPSHPITVEWAMGSTKPGDVIWTTYAVHVIVSESVVQLLRSHGFTGWSLYDVSVRDKQGQLIPGYSGLAITGRCGKIDYTRTVVVPRVYPAGIFPIGKGLLFDPESWDGSDLFMPADNVGYKFMVERVKKALERAKIRNVSFTPLDQFEVQMMDLKKAGVVLPPG